MMLSQFDWANWSLKDDYVEWDESLAMSVLDAGDYYWDHVLRAQVPPYIVRPELEGAQEYAQAMFESAKTYAALSALAAAASERADKIKSQLLQPISGKRFGGAKVEFSDPATGQKLLSLSANKYLDRDLVSKLFEPHELDACAARALEYDAEAMAQALKEMGVDVSKFRKRKLDADKVFALAAQKGVDPERLVREQVVAKVSSHIKDMMRDYIDEAYPLVHDS